MSRHKGRFCKKKKITKKEIVQPLRIQIQQHRYFVRVLFLVSKQSIEEPLE